MLCLNEKMERMLKDANVAGATVAISDADKIVATYSYGRRVAEDAEKPTLKVLAFVYTNTIYREGKLLPLRYTY